MGPKQGHQVSPLGLLLSVTKLRLAVRDLEARVTKLEKEINR